MTKLIPILSGRCLVLELPKKAHGFKVTEKGNLTYFNYDELKGSYPSVHALPPGTWQIVGMLSEVTEAQCRELVDEAESGYKGYIPNSRLTYKGRALGMSAFGHAWKSLLSAIFAAGYYLDENPYQPSTPKIWKTDQIMYMRMEKDYTAAQSRVLSRERCLLLRREI